MNTAIVDDIHLLRVILPDGEKVYFTHVSECLAYITELSKELDRNVHSYQVTDDFATKEGAKSLVLWLESTYPLLRKKFAEYMGAECMWLGMPSKVDLSS